MRLHEPHLLVFLLFFIAFVINFGEIFLEYSWRILFKIFEKVFNLKKKSSYYFIKVHVRILLKHVIFKKIEIHKQIFLLFKNKHYNV
jgi:hypothetical protein